MSAQRAAATSGGEPANEERDVVRLDAVTVAPDRPYTFGSDGRPPIHVSGQLEGYLHHSTSPVTDASWPVVIRIACQAADKHNRPACCSTGWFHPLGPLVAHNGTGASSRGHHAYPLCELAEVAGGQVTAGRAHHVPDEFPYGRHGAYVLRSGMLGP